MPISVQSYLAKDRRRRVTFGVSGCRVVLGLTALALAAVTVTAAPAASASTSSSNAGIDSAASGRIRSADQPNLCISGKGQEDKLQLRLVECSTASIWWRPLGADPSPGIMFTWDYHECMGVRDASRNNGARVQQNDCNGNTSQLWTVDYVRHEIRNANSGKCVSAPSLTAGVGLIQYDCGVYPSTWHFPTY